MSKELVTTLGKLKYSIYGCGHENIFFVFNAVGQSMKLWKDFLQQLSKRNQVIFFNEYVPEGKENPEEVYYNCNISVDDHKEMVKSILSAENITKVIFIAWCAGGKLAMEIGGELDNLVSKIVLLAPSFAGINIEEDSDFEKNLFEVCRSVDSSPEASELVCKTSRITMEAKLKDTEDEKKREVTKQLYRPFTDADSFRDYSARILRFYKHTVEIKEFPLKLHLVLPEVDESTSTKKSVAFLGGMDCVAIHYINGVGHALQFENAIGVADLCSAIAK